MTWWRLILVAAPMVAAAGGTASAQPRSAGRPARVELGVGLTWIGVASIGGSDANETTPGGGSSRLFSTSTDLGAAPGVDARVGVRLTDLLQIEGAASYSTPSVRTTIGNDVETSDLTIATEAVKQIVVEADVLVFLSRQRAGKRGTPFISAGAGYLRQLHEGATLVQTGRTFQAGGGVKFVLAARNRSPLKTVGVRADARAVARVSGVTLDGRTHLSPALGAGLFFGF